MLTGEPRLFVEALADPDPAAWKAWIWSPRLPDSTGLMWEPGELLEDVGLHVWRDTRGPYSLCHRPECRLAYSLWIGGRCPGVPVVLEPHHAAGRQRTDDEEVAVLRAEARRCPPTS